MISSSLLKEDKTDISLFDEGQNIVNDILSYYENKNIINNIFFLRLNLKIIF